MSFGDEAQQARNAVRGDDICQDIGSCWRETKIILHHRTSVESPNRHLDHYRQLVVSLFSIDVNYILRESRLRILEHAVEQQCTNA